MITDNGNEIPDTWLIDGEIPEDLRPGVVSRGHGKYYAIAPLDGSSEVLGTIRGALKRDRSSTDPVAVGDRVWFFDAGAGEGRILHVAPRQSELSRPSRRSEVANQVILANPDQACFLFSYDEPKPHLRTLDRFLVLSESAGIPALIAVNKIDLWDPAAGDPSPRDLFGPYEREYPVHYLSAEDGSGVDELRDDLAGKITVLAGPSGGGKSTLVNELIEESRQSTGEISSSSGKGRHTTTTSEIIQIGPDTHIADTPGIKALAMAGVSIENLDEHFPEFRPHLGQCRFNDCQHLSEPGCAILGAVEAGDINRPRYESYTKLLLGEDG